MKNIISSRVLIVACAFFLVFVLLVAKLFTIQIGKHEYFALVADRQQNKPEIIKAERGLIKDANGEILCYTENNISFYADRRMMTPARVDSICSAFERVFGKSKQYYKKLIDEGVNNVCLEKKVPMDKALLLNKTVVEGLKSEQDFTRVYPYGSLASHILGYVRNEHGEIKGIEGIEKTYNKTLTGIDGNAIYERDVLGRILSVNDKLTQPAVTGNTVNLTVNKTYQKILEEELGKGLQKFGGESAVGIIMNPNTGEILALANSPDFDPANYDLFPDNARRDRAITDTYEPGSTMKPIVMSILLDNKLVKENEVINTENGRYVLNGVKIFDDHKSGQLTVREIISKSSNIGMSKLSARIPDETLYKYLRDFGFSSLTTIDLPSEEEGMLKKPKDFTPVISKAFMSFGYEVAVTPLQLLSAYCSIINGGTLWKPFLVKSVVDHTGKIVEENQPKKIRTTIEKATSDKIKSMMIDVVEKGTGR
jgi:cell division protein FtsI (penicillin-binding protein 3)